VQVFAIGDLHFPGAGGKTMDVFGPHWIDHPQRIAADWDARVADHDLVLVPGDISWGLRLDEARDDLAWLGHRPGTKVIIRGNHDYWWQTIGKVRAALPDRCHAIQNDAWTSPDGTVVVGGTRLWDVPGLRLGPIFADAPEGAAGVVGSGHQGASPDDEKIFEREMGRLRRSLDQMPEAPLRIVMVHYPPTNPELAPTEVTKELEARGIDLCVFGHLHNLRPGVTIDGTRGGTRYVLTSADVVGFRLVELTSTP
jgi:hypothetical protein